MTSTNVSTTVLLHEIRLRWSSLHPEPVHIPELTGLARAAQRLVHGVAWTRLIRFHLAAGSTSIEIDIVL